MNITAKKSKITTIKPNDPRFILQDGLTICPRAGFELSQRMPSEYRMIITECLQNGWLIPVAHVHGKELTIDALR